MGTYKIAVFSPEMLEKANALGDWLHDCTEGPGEAVCLIGLVRCLIAELQQDASGIPIETVLAESARLFTNIEKIYLEGMGADVIKAN